MGASSIASENEARKAWKAKYGSQFDMPDSEANSRAGTSMSQRNDNPSRQTSRPGTQMSQNSQGSQNSNRTSASVAKRKHLQDLKKKLMSALEEVDCELDMTTDIGDSRSSTRMTSRMS